MQASPLAELKDIHLPEPATLWPLAYGWWILLAILAFGVVALIIWQIKRWKLNLAKRQALSELSTLTSMTENWPQRLQQIMRRLIVSYFQQEHVAQLYGDQWVQFLLAQVKTSQHTKCSDELHTLVNSQYQQTHSALDFEKQMAAVKYWIVNALPPKANTTTYNSPSPLKEGQQHV